MGGKPRASGGLLDGVNARLGVLERGLATMTLKYTGLEFEIRKAGKCTPSMLCHCLQCRLYRMVTEDSPVE